MSKPFKYSVVVGNVGTVHEGNLRNMAIEFYRGAVANSKNGSGKAKGEAVTLFEDGEPIEEHQGYQYMYENLEANDLQRLLSDRRTEDKGICPACSTVVKHGTLACADHVMNSDGLDHRVRIPCKCPGCGLEWMDIYQTVGVELP